MTAEEEVRQLRQALGETLKGQHQAWQVLGGALAKLVGAEALRNALLAELQANLLVRGENIVAEQLVKGAVAACDAALIEGRMTPQ
jgi:hypothetical protein